MNSKLAAVNMSICPNCKGVKTPNAARCHKCAAKFMSAKTEDAQLTRLEDVVEVYLSGGASIDVLAKMRRVTRERMRQILEKLKTKWSLDTMLGFNVRCGKKDAPNN